MICDICNDFCMSSKQYKILEGIITLIGIDFKIHLKKNNNVTICDTCIIKDSVKTAKLEQI